MLDHCMTAPICTVDTLHRCWSTFHTFQMWSVQIIACLPYFTSDQQEKEAMHAWLVTQPKAQKLWPGILSALKIRLILWKNDAMYRPKKNVMLFSNNTFHIFFDSPTYVKKLNYPSICLKKRNLRSDYAVCLLLVTKLNHWPDLPVMCVTKLDRHSILPSLPVICYKTDSSQYLAQFACCVCCRMF